MPPYKKPFKKPFVKNVRGKRVLIIDSIAGKLHLINQLASSIRADYVVHVGNFGFFDGESTLNMTTEQLVAAAESSAILPPRNYAEMDASHLREVVGSQISELPLFLAGQSKFHVPVYTIWGAVEDVHVVERFFSGVYNITNLHLVSDHTAPILPGTGLKLMGVPGLFDPSALFDIGEGKFHPGTHASAWTSAWQIGELAHASISDSEGEDARWLLTCAPQDRSLLDALAINLSCDLHVYSSLGEEAASIYSLDALSVSSLKFLVQQAQRSFNTGWKKVSHGVLDACDADLAALLESTVQLLVAEPDFARGIVQTRLLTPGNVKSNTVLISFENGRSSLSLRNYADSEVSNGKADDEKDTGDTKDATGAATTAAKTAFGKAGHEKSPSTDEDEAANGKPLDAKQPRSDRSSPGAEPKSRNRSRFDAPGLWFKNGELTAEQLLSYLAPEDREKNPVVKYTQGSALPNGKVPTNALVLFETQEQASTAYERVNKEQAGTVSIYEPHQKGFAKNKRKSRK